MPQHDWRIICAIGQLPETKPAIQRAYTEALENIITLKDSVAAMNSTEAIAEMQAKYDVQEKRSLSRNYSYPPQYNALWVYWIYRDGGHNWPVGIPQPAPGTAGKTENCSGRRKEHGSCNQFSRLKKKNANVLQQTCIDNIGAYATAIRDDVDKITGKSDEAHLHLDHLRQHSQEIINSLRDTIWVLNKGKYHHNRIK